MSDRKIIATVNMKNHCCEDKPVLIVRNSGNGDPTYSSECACGSWCTGAQFSPAMALWEYEVMNDHYEQEDGSKIDEMKRRLLMCDRCVVDSKMEFCEDCDLIRDFDYILSLFKGKDITPYPNTKLINMKDSNGIIHSYYTSTGTAIFRKENEKYGDKEIVKNLSPQEFIRRVECR